MNPTLQGFAIAFAWLAVVIFMCAKFFAKRWDISKQEPQQEASQQEYESQQASVLKERLNELK